jgi:hypothetical protein
VEERFPDLPGWVFKVEEVSNGYYRVTGRHVSGSEVSAMDSDLDALMERCRRDAGQLRIRPR